MTSKVWSPGTVIPSDWLQDVDDHVYKNRDVSTVNSIIPTSYPYNAIGDGVVDDTASLIAAWAACPNYGVIDLQGKTYMITAPIPRPNIGVTIRNGRVFVNNPAAMIIYAMVANDDVVFDTIHFKGTGVVGTTTTGIFTGSVGGATSGTLTSSITNSSYVFTFSNGESRYVTVTGGTSVSWSGALAAGTVLSASIPETPRYQGGIFGGNTSYSSPLNTTPANNVTVKGCIFEELTACIFNGGSSTDPVPSGWQVYGNTFKNVVGVPSLSEGYGCLFTPSKDGLIAYNIFFNVRRHAIYGASEWSNNIVTGNVINGCDNIAIQSNTGVTQNYADGNIISNNTITTLTRSVPYGYRSSVGIGLYGKIKNTTVSGNRIFGALDTGIDTAAELSGSAYGTNINIQNNHIDMDASATDAGIRIDGVQNGNNTGNYIKLKGSSYGFVITSNVTTATGILNISQNTVDTTSGSSVMFRIALGILGPRNISIKNNTIFGVNSYTQMINDTSTSGVVRTDLNSNAGFYGADSSFIHYSGGTKSNTDCPVIRFANPITAIRTISLDKTVAPDPGSIVTITRPASSTGAFELNVLDGVGGGVIKGISTKNWASFAFNGSGWEQTGAGTL